MTPIRSPADIIRAVGDKLSALKQDLRWDEALSNCVHVCVLCPSKNDEEDTVYGQLPSYERQYRQVLGEIGVGSFSWRTLRLSEQHLWRATLQAEYEVQAARFKGERGSGAGGNQLVLFNLCDSDESDGYPGTSVVRMLDAGAAALPPAATKTAAAAPVSSKSAATASFTGADLPFFLVSTDKFLMKQRFAQVRRARAGGPPTPIKTTPIKRTSERSTYLNLYQSISIYTNLF